MKMLSNRQRWSLQALAIGAALMGAVVGLSSCFTSNTQECESGVVCPAGFVCTADGTSCKLPDALCGNGMMEGAEACDDGNVLRGDGCNVDCTSDESCGNGFVDLDMPFNRDDDPALCLDSTTPGTKCREECDLGPNMNVPGSGCSPNCLSDETCGNGILDDHLPNSAPSTIPPHPCLSNDSNTNCVEVCDDGNIEDGDECSPNCLSVEMCGNGIVDIGEVCDDGDRDDASGCRNDCQSSAECGDGEVGPGEECDDTDESVSCDGPNALPESEACTIRVCGDGYVNAVAGMAADGSPIPGEICDPGSIGGDIDDCDRDCTRPLCGDGITNAAAGEQCDDGATAALVNGDGCSTMCQLEPFSLGVTLISNLGGGTGSVSSTPAGINCGTDCFEPYSLNSMVTLMATPAAQNTFDGWTGCNSVVGGNCLITMVSPRAVVARFEPNKLTVVRDGTGSGSVTATGINCGTDCTESYDVGTMVTLTANPVTATSDFTGWSDPGCPGTGPCTVTMNAARTVTATFTLRLFALNVAKNGTGTGAVLSVPAGINCGADCMENYVSGTSVTLFAEPTADSDFTGWSFGTCGTAVSCVVPMTMAQSVTATFTLKTFLLTATKSGSGAGTVASTPAGINCGADCTEIYNIFTSVTLTATPSAGSRFVGWSGACAGTGPCVVTMDIAKSVNAEFRLIFDLTVTRSGSGAGTVTSDVAGINCGADCNELYDLNTIVTLTPTPNAGSRFVAWTGACTGSGACSVTMSAARTVNAEFRTVFDLTVVKAGSGAGTVTSSPAGIGCGIDCTETYDTGTVVTLTAVAASGSRFAGWSGGGCTGTGTCVTTMDASKTVTATFIAIYDLTVTKIGSGAGTVTSSPAGINCGGDCSEIYDLNTVVTLTATPTAGSRFVQWTGDCSGSTTCVVTMDAAKTVTAEFRTEFLLTVTRTGTGGGSVDSAPAGITCGADCTQLYDVGTSVTLTATPDANSRFVQWTGGSCTGTNPVCTVDMTVARTATAEFRTVRVLTVVKNGTGLGTVTSAPTGINCGGDCTETYDNGTSVTLTAVAAAGSRFVGWSGGGCTGTGTCVVPMTAATTVTATFNSQFLLTVAKIGGGAGTVSSAPAGINCGADCTELYDSGDVIALTATPSAGSRFVQWTGACTGTGACNVTMTAAQTVTAEFRETFVLTVTRSGSGTGTVASAPAGIGCGVDCTETYDTGTDVTLTATPNAGSRFVQWTGACTGSGACVVTMSQARTVNAEFQTVQVLTVTKSGAGTGAVAAVPTGTPGITIASCGNGVTPCTSSFDTGTLVTLTATPQAGATVGTWTGCATNPTPTTCTVTMSAARTVDVAFNAVFTLTVNKTGTASGTVTGTGINCGSDCTETYNGGTVIVLTASTGSENAFTGWSAGCTSTTTFTCTVTMDAAKTITANFEDNTLTLNLTGSGAGNVSSDNHPATAALDCDRSLAGNQTGNCAEDYDQGTAVLLTATAVSGSRFVSWSGGGCPTTIPPATPPPTCTVTVNAPTTVTAQFARLDTLTVTKSGGTGVVSSSPTGINCGATCSGDFDRNSLVTLTATPDPGMRFVAWTGACVNVPPDPANVCQVTMTGALSTNAQFAPNTLAVTRAGTMSTVGSVTSSPAGITCGGATPVCSANFNSPTTVTLTAVPGASTFGGWSGCTPTGDPLVCTVTVTTGAAVTATFN